MRALALVAALAAAASAAPRLTVEPLATPDPPRSALPAAPVLPSLTMPTAGEAPDVAAPRAAGLPAMAILSQVSGASVRPQTGDQGDAALAAAYDGGSLHAFPKDDDSWLAEGWRELTRPYRLRPRVVDPENVPALFEAKARALHLAIPVEDRPAAERALLSALAPLRARAQGRKLVAHPFLALVSAEAELRQAAWQAVKPFLSRVAPETLADSAAARRHRPGPSHAEFEVLAAAGAPGRRLLETMSVLYPGARAVLTEARETSSVAEVAQETRSVSDGSGNEGLLRRADAAVASPAGAMSARLRQGEIARQAAALRAAPDRESAALASSRLRQLLDESGPVTGSGAWAPAAAAWRLRRGLNSPWLAGALALGALGLPTVLLAPQPTLLFFWAALAITAIITFFSAAESLARPRLLMLLPWLGATGAAGYFALSTAVTVILVAAAAVWAGGVKAWLARPLRRKLGWRRAWELKRAAAKVPARSRELAAMIVGYANERGDALREAAKGGVAARDLVALLARGLEAGAFTPGQAHDAVTALHASGAPAAQAALEAFGRGFFPDAALKDEADRARALAQELADTLRQTSVLQELSAAAEAPDETDEALLREAAAAAKSGGSSLSGRLRGQEIARAALELRTSRGDAAAVARARLAALLADAPASAGAGAWSPAALAARLWPAWKYAGIQARSLGLRSGIVAGVSTVGWLLVTQKLAILPKLTGWPVAGFALAVALLSIMQFNKSKTPAGVVAFVMPLVMSTIAIPIMQALTHTPDMVLLGMVPPILTVLGWALVNGELGHPTPAEATSLLRQARLSLAGDDLRLAADLAAASDARRKALAEIGADGTRARRFGPLLREALLEGVFAKADQEAAVAAVEAAADDYAVGTLARFAGGGDWEKEPARALAAQAQDRLAASLAALRGLEDLQEPATSSSDEALLQRADALAAAPPGGFAESLRAEEAARQARALRSALTEEEAGMARARLRALVYGGEPEGAGLWSPFRSGSRLAWRLGRALRRPGPRFFLPAAALLLAAAAAGGALTPWLTLLGPLPGLVGVVAFVGSVFWSVHKNNGEPTAGAFVVGGTVASFGFATVGSWVVVAGIMVTLIAGLLALRVDLDAQYLSPLAARRIRRVVGPLPEYWDRRVNELTGSKEERLTLLDTLRRDPHQARTFGPVLRAALHDTRALRTQVGADRALEAVEAAGDDYAVRTLELYAQHGPLRDEALRAAARLRARSSSVAPLEALTGERDGAPDDAALLDAAEQRLAGLGSGFADRSRGGELRRAAEALRQAAAGEPAALARARLRGLLQENGADGAGAWSPRRLGSRLAWRVRRLLLPSAGSALWSATAKGRLGRAAAFIAGEAIWRLRRWLAHPAGLIAIGFGGGFALFAAGELAFGWVQEPYAWPLAVSLGKVSGLIVSLCVTAYLLLPNDLGWSAGRLLRQRRRALALSAEDRRLATELTGFQTERDAALDTLLADPARARTLSPLVQALARALPEGQAPRALRAVAAAGDRQALDFLASDPRPAARALAEELRLRGVGGLELLATPEPETDASLRARAETAAASLRGQAGLADRLRAQEIEREAARLDGPDAGQARIRLARLLERL